MLHPVGYRMYGTSMMGGRSVKQGAARVVRVCGRMLDNGFSQRSWKRKHLDGYFIARRT
jgi:hypothetical protein